MKMTFYYSFKRIVFFVAGLTGFIKDQKSFFTVNI